MTDIVERLRAGWVSHQCAEEAADEIERLRAALDTLTDANVWLRTEVQRLMRGREKVVENGGEDEKSLQEKEL